MVYLCHTAHIDRKLCRKLFALCKMNFLDLDRIADIHIILHKDLFDLVRTQFLLLVIRHALHHIAYILAHLRRKIEAELLLHDEADPALAGLAVDTDHISIVLSSHILRIERKIRNRPQIGIPVCPVFHTLRDRILMRAGECGKYQLTRIRSSLVYMHSGHTLIHLGKLRNIAEIKLRIYAVRIHIHGKRYDIDITGTLSIAK